VAQVTPKHPLVYTPLKLVLFASTYLILKLIRNQRHLGSDDNKLVFFSVENVYSASRHNQLLVS
jgi:hypothetical protein